MKLTRLHDGQLRYSFETTTEGQSPSIGRWLMTRAFEFAELNDVPGNYHMIFSSELRRLAKLGYQIIRSRDIGNTASDYALMPHLAGWRYGIVREGDKVGVYDCQSGSRVSQLYTHEHVAKEYAAAQNRTLGLGVLMEFSDASR